VRKRTELLGTKGRNHGKRKNAKIRRKPWRRVNDVNSSKFTDNGKKVTKKPTWEQGQRK